SPTLRAPRSSFSPYTPLFRSVREAMMMRRENHRMAIDKELLDRLLAGRDPNEVFSRDGLLDDLKKALSERILSTELDEHLDDERSEEHTSELQSRENPVCRLP